MIAEPSMPVGWRSEKLEDLVTEKQCQDILKIINSNQDSTKRVMELTRYLCKLRSELEKKGVLPEYLAYAIENHVLNG